MPARAIRSAQNRRLRAGRGVRFRHENAYSERRRGAVALRARKKCLMVMVYGFKGYDIASDSDVVSRRWATLEAIQRIGGEAVGEGQEVPAEDVGSEVDGMTVVDYNPPALRMRGFPHYVKP